MVGEPRELVLLATPSDPTPLGVLKVSVSKSGGKGRSTFAMIPSTPNVESGEPLARRFTTRKEEEFKPSGRWKDNVLSSFDTSSRHRGKPALSARDTPPAPKPVSSAPSRLSLSMH